MAIPASTAGPRAAGRDHGFHALRIRRVVRETNDASTFVLAVPDDLRPAFAYRAGQFCTFRVVVDGQPQLRSYSMSSTPGIDDELQVTVKRVPGGVVSNWMHDTLQPGDLIDATLPAGVFTLDAATAGGSPTGDIVAFAAGSGITPVFSLVKAALTDTDRSVRLLYANRDRESVIFADALDGLVERHGDRLQVVHHLDDDTGYLAADAIRPFLDEVGESHIYLCGPVPFMDLVERTVVEHGVEPARIHLERFAPSEPSPVEPEPTGHEQDASRQGAPQVTMELDGRTATTAHHPGATILQTARQAGLSPPYSCESGSCATCMARVVEGTVTMRTNNALDEDEVADGWILTCQSVPTSPTIHVIYGHEDT